MRVFPYIDDGLLPGDTFLPSPWRLPRTRFFQLGLTSWFGSRSLLPSDFFFESGFPLTDEEESPNLLSVASRSRIHLIFFSLTLFLPRRPL